MLKSKFAGRFMLVCLCVSQLSACSFMLDSVADDFASSLNQSILNHPDPDTVLEAIPAFLILLDGMTVQRPDDPSSFRSAAQLYGAYAGVWMHQPVRAQPLTERAWQYAQQAACLEHQTLCGIDQMAFMEFSQVVASTDTEHLPSLFLLGSTWAGWIQSHKDDWNAVAKLPYVVSLMTRVTQLDAHYQYGTAYVYLGVMASLLPESLGGKPEQGHEYFEQAWELSGHKNLMARVLFAQHYARITYNRTLHDQVLNEILTMDPRHADLTLSNQLAIRQARELLKTANDYF